MSKNSATVEKTVCFYTRIPKTHFNKEPIQTFRKKRNEVDRGRNVMERARGRFSSAGVGGSVGGEQEERREGNSIGGKGKAIWVWWSNQGGRGHNSAKQATT